MTNKKLCTIPACNYPEGECSGACYHPEEQRMDVIGQNGPTGEHYDHVPQIERGTIFWPRFSEGGDPTEKTPQNETGGIDAVLSERGSRYGRFVDHASITMSLKNAIRWHREVREFGLLADDQQEALDMICHKIGRIVNGDPNYADSWIDIAGYAKLVADRLEGKA